MPKQIKENGFVYRQIAEDLIKRIKKNEFSNARLPSERQLAQKYKVNRLTLRKSLDILANEKHIYRFGAKGTFIGQPSGSMKAARCKTIGFLLVNRDIFDEHHSKTILALEKAVKGHNANMMLFTINSEKEEGSMLSELALMKNLDGVLVSGLVTAKIIKALKRLNIPLGLLGQLVYADPIEECVDRVIVDSIKYSYMATQYLIDGGHRRIALLNGPSYRWFLNIYQGYMKALLNAHIEYDERLVRKCEQDTSEKGYDAMKQILELGSGMPTAIFAANDRIAYGAIDAIKERGLTIPDDISIIGNGNYEDSKYRRPPLTTIEIERGKLVGMALDMLFKRMRNNSGRAQIKYAPFNLIERASCKKIEINREASK